MSSRAKPAATTWRPPVDVTSYDRDPELSQGEYHVLDAIMRRPGKRTGGWGKQSHRVLQRLLRPLYDVYDIGGTNRNAMRRSVSRLLVEMHQRRTAFWGWSRDEWLETVCPNYAQFYRRHKECAVSRQYIVAVSYLLCGFTDVRLFGHLHPSYLAPKVFGQEAVDAAVGVVHETLLGWGFTPYFRNQRINALCLALIDNHSPRLEDLTFERLSALCDGQMPEYLRGHLSTLSRVLVSLGILEKPLPPRGAGDRQGGHTAGALRGVPPEWAAWCQRWRETSTHAPKTRKTAYYNLLLAGRWAARTHPEAVTPERWTRGVAADYTAAVCRMKVGQFSYNERIGADKVGKPFTARAKAHLLSSLRMFFRDCQEWGWVALRFDPSRSLATPRSITSQVGPDPRVIGDNVWAKLLSAGLNLTAEDLPNSKPPPRRPWKISSWYPTEMLRAVVIVWLFAGLRSDEICRLRVGCVRRAQEDATPADAQGHQQRVCLLDLPVNKTSPAFTKPVDGVVGEAVLAWEGVRPPQPLSVDPKTGELVHFLFFYRGQRMAKRYLNKTLIPRLCHKAGVPVRDARGNITSHRARSTIASQLCNARQPLSLFELQQWLGHKNANSTMSYVKSSLTKLTRSYADAEYFRRNLRMIEVLIDREAVESGAAAGGAPWKYYDLGHGYCTYDFFEQCPHRMACARCSFYVPKDSSQAQLLEAKANLQRMLQEIPLRDEERAAVEDGLAAVEKLYERLVDIPTPTGPTPREMTGISRRELPVISAVRRDSSPPETK